MDDLEEELSNNITQSKEQYVNGNNSIALEHYVEVLQSNKCKLCPLGQHSIQVISRGNFNSRIAIIGQNPGFEELKEKIPFVGKSGKLLDHMLEKSELIKAKPYITNIGLCGTPNNRPLTQEEQQKCDTHWKTQILFLRPKIILATGKIAINTIIPETKNLKVKDIIETEWTYDNKYENVKVFAIYHPSFILRQEQNSQIYIENTIEIMKKIVLILKSIPKDKDLF